MRAAVVVAIACACSGPSKSPHPDPGRPSIAGLVWATEPQPFHLPRMPFSVGSDGKQLLLVGTRGWIAELDPATGRVVRQSAPDHSLIFENIAPLGNGKWIASALKTIAEPYAVVSAAYIVDGATLQTAEMKLSPVAKNPGYAVPHVSVLRDGGVVITGRGLPLAIYDPATGSVRQMLDPAIGWNSTYVRGDILIANRGGAAKRWDLSTNGQKDLPRGWTHAAIGDTATALRIQKNNVWVAVLYPDGGAEKALPDPIDALAIDATGKRLITSSKNEIRVHALPSGDIVKRIPIKGVRRISQLHSFGAKIAVVNASVLTIVDLDTGAVVPPDQGLGSISTIAVGNDGHVLAGSMRIVALADGKQVGSIDVGESGIENFRRDDPVHYATSESDNHLSLHTVGDPKATKIWAVPDVPRTTWIARDGSLVVDVYENHALLHTRGDELVPLFERNSEAELLDVDPDGDVLISLDGRVAVASQDGKARSTITVPECQDIIAEGVIEPGGPRAATFTISDLALWDRAAAKVLATAKYDEEPDKVLFMPKRAELVLVNDDNVVLWTPGKGTHTLAQGNVNDAAVSADGKRLALGHNDGHVSVWDVDALLVGPFGRELPPSTEVKPECGKRDPLAPNPPDPDGDEPGEDGVEGGEEGIPD